ncbi:hypothetical protein WDW37_09430 [Bdellovibrionota bacterium FG-1]
MTTMKSAIEKILAAHQQLDAFRANEHYAVKIASNGFMPISIEKHDKQITVTHYFLDASGDLCPDPDVEYVDLGGADWLPVAIQHSTGLYCRAAEQAASGNWLISKRAMRDLQSFSRMWARNLLSNIRRI